MDTYIKPQLNSNDQNFWQFIKLTFLPCGHIYHEYCLQHYDYKCLYRLKYIKNQININVESINRLTSEKNFPIEDDPKDEIQLLEIDEPEEYKWHLIFKLRLSLIQHFKSS
ncbi:11273_t:CDS:1 [Entrophospora sp. SA101]|nr:11273_t:CDS:1 [Entrophospora sp. SA101]